MQSLWFFCSQPQALSRPVVNILQSKPHPNVRTQRRAFRPCAAAPGDVFVLDFDGVIADSQFEVNSAGLDSAARRWPNLQISAAERERVLAGLATVRPRLVKGYESMVMARLILEDPANVAAILESDWETGLLRETLAAWGEVERPLVDEFERYRSERVAKDPAAWAALCPLYEGVADALADCAAPFYICSSKRGDRLIALLRALLGMDVEEGSPRVMSSLIPPSEKKVEALRLVAARPVAADRSTTLHFVDDRFETLAAVAAEPDLAQRYSLYLAGWGYNTKEERAAAAALPGVRVISLPQFHELLRFQIIMGVDDGCQDTEEEYLEAVYKPFGIGKDEE